MNHQITIPYRHPQSGRSGRLIVTVQNDTEDGATPAQVLARAVARMMNPTDSLLDLAGVRTGQPTATSWPDFAGATRRQQLADRLGLFMELAGAVKGPSMVMDPCQIGTVLDCTPHEAATAIDDLIQRGALRHAPDPGADAGPAGGGILPIRDEPGRN